MPSRKSASAWSSAGACWPRTTTPPPPCASARGGRRTICRWPVQLMMRRPAAPTPPRCRIPPHDQFHRGRRARRAPVVVHHAGVQVLDAQDVKALPARGLRGADDTNCRPSGCCWYRRGPTGVTKPDGRALRRPWDAAALNLHACVDWWIRADDGERRGLPAPCRARAASQAPARPGTPESRHPGTRSSAR